MEDLIYQDLFITSDVYKLGLSFFDQCHYFISFPIPCNSNIILALCTPVTSSNINRSYIQASKGDYYSDRSFTDDGWFRQNMMLIYPEICGPYPGCFNYWTQIPCQGRNASDFPVQFIVGWTASLAWARNEWDLDFTLYYFCLPKYVMSWGQTET